MDNANWLTMQFTGQELQQLRELRALLLDRGEDWTLGDVARELVMVQGPLWAERIRRGEDE